MAPEQIQGEGELDARADLFAFGCVLYELVTGERAFVGKNLFDTLSRIVSEQPQRIAQDSPDLPPQLQWILGKCLAKDPAERYQTAADLAVDLRRLGAGIGSGTIAAQARDAERVGAGAVSRPAGISWNLALPTAALLLVAGATGAWLLSPPAAQPDATVYRYTIDYPPDTLVQTASPAA